MIISARHELYVLFGSVLGGMIIGMIFDVFKLCTAGRRHNAVIMGIGDLLLWSIVSVAVFAIIFILNDAKVRWYEFAGMILGMVIYFMTLSRLFLKLMSFLVHVVKCVVIFLVKVILLPVRLCLRVFSPVIALAKRSLRVVKRIYKKSLFKIKNFTKRLKHSVNKM